MYFKLEPNLCAQTQTKSETCYFFVLRIGNDCNLSTTKTLKNLKREKSFSASLRFPLIILWCWMWTRAHELSLSSVSLSLVVFASAVLVDGKWFTIINGVYCARMWKLPIQISATCSNASARRDRETKPTSKRNKKTTTTERNIYFLSFTFGENKRIKLRISKCIHWIMKNDYNRKTVFLFITHTRIQQLTQMNRWWSKLFLQKDKKYRWKRKIGNRMDASQWTMKHEHTNERF